MLTLRSLLFVPANRPQRFEKALSSGADVVIIDLEDAVSEKEKREARELVAAWLSPQRKVYIRINGVETPWFQEDLILARSLGVSGVVLPKTEGTEEILAVTSVGICQTVLPMIETAKGLNNLQKIAATRGVHRLVFGSIDFQVDMGICGDDIELLPYRSQIVLASRLAGLVAPVDGVTIALDDSVALRNDSLRARRLGFGGKLCIHPKQVDLVNTCLGPSDEELQWAHRVLEGSSQSSGGVVKLDGNMVDRPLFAKAQAIVQEATARSRSKSALPQISKRFWSSLFRGTTRCE